MRVTMLVCAPRLSDGDERMLLKTMAHRLRGLGKNPMNMANSITLIACVKLSF